MAGLVAGAFSTSLIFHVCQLERHDALHAVKARVNGMFSCLLAALIYFITVGLVRQNDRFHQPFPSGGESRDSALFFLLLFYFCA